MDIIKQIGYAMSLRDPQKEALEVLHSISSQIEYKTATKSEAEAMASANCESKQAIKVADEFSFPSFCRLRSFLQFAPLVLGASLSVVSSA